MPDGRNQNTRLAESIGSILCEWEVCSGCRFFQDGKLVWDRGCPSCSIGNRTLGGGSKIYRLRGVPMDRRC